MKKIELFINVISKQIEILMKTEKQHKIKVIYGMIVQKILSIITLFHFTDVSRLQIICKNIFLYLNCLTYSSPNHNIKTKQSAGVKSINPTGRNVPISVDKLTSENHLTKRMVEE